MRSRTAQGGCIPSTILLLFCLTGCSILPEAKPDPTRFFVLSTSTPRSSPAPSAPVVHLRDVEVASYLDTRPLVVRRGDNEIEFREFALWGEALDRGVARVLREELLARGAASSVVTSSTRGNSSDDDLRLSIRVLACEGGADGAVLFRASWRVVRMDVRATDVASGFFQPGELRWDGKSDSALVAQLSQAIAGLAGEIAAALPKK